MLLEETAAGTENKYLAVLLQIVPSSKVSLQWEFGFVLLLIPISRATSLWASDGILPEFSHWDDFLSRVIC